MLNNQTSFFFDRSFLDSAALIHDSDGTYFNGIKKLIETHRFNTKVFITPPWHEIYKTHDERDQPYEESIRVYNKMFDWYQLNGYHFASCQKPWPLNE